MDFYNNKIKDNESLDLQKQIDKIKQIRLDKIRKIKILAEKIGININSLSESQLDQLLNEIDLNSLKLIQKLSDKIKLKNEQYANQLLQFILNDDFDGAMNFLSNIQNEENSNFKQFNKNFYDAQKQLIYDTINSFFSSIKNEDNKDNYLSNKLQLSNDVNVDFNIINSNYNEKTQILTVYVDINKIKNYELVGFKFVLEVEGDILDILITNDAKKEIFDGKFYVYKFSNENLIKDNDFVLTMIKFLGNVSKIPVIKDIMLRIRKDNNLKEINL